MSDTLQDERALLAIALAQPEKLAMVTLPFAAFTNETNRRIYRALVDLQFSGEPITTATIVAACEGIDEGYLRRLLLEAEPLGVIGFYAERLAKAYEHQRDLALLREMFEDVSSGDPLAGCLQRTAERLGAIECEPTSPVSVDQLIHAHPCLNAPVVHGLLRRGETANIVAAPKVGKSWLVYDLCLAVATGSSFLGRFRCEQGRVLLIDNELHPPTLANRIRTTAEALGITLADVQDRFQVEALRGQMRDIHAISQELGRVKPGTWDVIVADAFYRFLPAGVSENANEQITTVYNLIDSTTKRLGCCWVNIHHASKGNQSDKSVTDVGAGAGSQSRAADTHIVLRPHQEEGVIVLDAVVRSFAPVEPLPLRWEFPCFSPVDGVDPSALLGKLTAQERRQSEKDAAALASIIEALQAEPSTARQLRSATGLSRERLQRLLDRLEADGKVTGESVMVRGNDARLYTLSGVVGDADRPGDRPGAHVGGRGVCGSYKEEPPTRPRHPEPARDVEGFQSRPRHAGTAEDPIPFGEAG